MNRECLSWVPLSAVDRDPTIQCRAEIDSATVAEYRDRMEAGDVFPPIDLFGNMTRCWIGDGWHRVLAAEAAAAGLIAARLHPGGRGDALKHALSANAQHGLRRTNGDKRWAVRIALSEFAGLSSRAIAGLCGVGDQLVGNVRAEVRDSRTCRKGADGKTYPAQRYRYHPACLAFPMMSDSELHGLAKSIRQTGQLVPVLRWRDWIIDGRQRIAACQLAGVEPVILDFNDALHENGHYCIEDIHTFADVADLVWSLNAVRASYSPEQAHLIHKQCMEKSAEWQREIAEVRS